MTSVKQLLRQIDPIDLVALVSVGVLGAGVALVFGVGVALMVVGSLGLLYALASTFVAKRAEPEGASE